jgi:WD40 repeat protein
VRTGESKVPRRALALTTAAVACLAGTLCCSTPARDQGAPVPAGAGRRPISGPIVAVALTGDGGRLITVARLSAEVWDVSKRTLILRRPISQSYYPLSRAVSPDGRWLAAQMTIAPGQVVGRGRVTGSRYETHLIEIDTGKTTALEPAVDGSVGGVAFSGDGGTIVRMTSQDDATVFQVWRVPSGELSASGSLPHLEVGPIGVAVSRNGDRFAFATHQRTPEQRFPLPPVGRIRICDSRSGSVVTTILVPDIPRAMRFSADATELYWAQDGDALIHVTDIQSGLETRTLLVPPERRALSSARPSGGRGAYLASRRMPRLASNQLPEG